MFHFYLIIAFFTRGYIHGWGTRKECLAPNHSQDTILNDHYIDEIIYLEDFFNILDIHILLDQNGGDFLKFDDKTCPYVS
jgi:hypothetical protein